MRPDGNVPKGGKFNRIMGKKRTVKKETQIEKIAKKHNIIEHVLERMIIQFHLLNKLTPKEKLVTMQIIDLNLELYNKVKAISKDLKIDMDSVITGFILNYLEENKK